MRLFRLTLLLVPMIAWAYLSFGEPRSFYLAEDDGEHATFYSAKLINANRRPFDLHMPGVTTSYSAATVMQVAGLNASRALLTARFLSAVFTGLALYAVARLTFRTTPIGMAAIALAPALAWPSFLFYFDYFDPNALQTPLGLLTIAVFLSSLEASGGSRLRRLSLCGVLLGLALATKFTFVPLAVAMLATTAIQMVRTEGAIRRRTAPLVVLAVAMAGSFVLIAAPVIGELPVTLLRLVASGDVRPESGQVGDLLESWRGLIAMNAPAAVVILGGAAAFLGQLLTRPAAQAAAGTAEFLVLMLAALAYTMAAADGDARGLRNAQPAALCVPFLLAHVFRTSGQHRPALRSFAFQGALLAVAVWIVVPPVAQRANERQVFIESRTAVVEETRARLLALGRPGTRVAVWDGSPGSLAGEELFHFWGNYRYASDVFDEQLLLQYPAFTFLRLREVPRLVRNEPAHDRQVDPEGRPQGRPQEMSSTLGWPGRLWRRFFPRGEFTRTDEIVAGESAGVQVCLVAIPEDEVKEELSGRRGATQAEFFALLESRFGGAAPRLETIAGVVWMLIDVCLTNPTSPAPSGGGSR